jgi:hypothetical protein
LFVEADSTEVVIWAAVNFEPREIVYVDITYTSSGFDALHFSAKWYTGAPVVRCCGMIAATSRIIHWSCYGVSTSGNQGSLLPIEI